MAKKGLQIEVMARVEIVFHLLMKGLRKTEICTYGKNNWDMSRGMVYKYILRAQKDILEMGSVGLEQRRAWHIAQRKQMLKEAEKRGRSKSLILKIAQDLARIEGVYEDKVLLITPEAKELKFREAYELAEGKDFEVVDGNSEFGT